MFDCFDVSLCDCGGVNVVVMVSGVSVGVPKGLSDVCRDVVFDGAPICVVGHSCQGRGNSVQEGWVEQCGVQSRSEFVDGGSPSLFEYRAFPDDMCDVRMPSGAMIDSAVKEFCFLSFGWADGAALAEASPS